MKKSWLQIVALITLLVAGIITTFVILQPETSDPIFSHDVAVGNANKPEQHLKRDNPPRDAQSRLQKLLFSYASKDEKIRAIQKYANDPTAASGSSVLQSAMLSQEEPEVRVAALVAADEIAQREGSESELVVLRTGLDSPHSEVRRESLRICRARPKKELLSELLKAARARNRERVPALQALAFLGVEEADQCILEIARSEDTPKNIRIQAVALLCKTSLADAVSYLKVVAAEEDPELSRVAIEALRIIQER